MYKFHAISVISARLRLIGVFVVFETGRLWRQRDRWRRGGRLSVEHESAGCIPIPQVWMHIEMPFNQSVSTSLTIQWLYELLSHYTTCGQVCPWTPLTCGMESQCTVNLSSWNMDICFNYWPLMMGFLSRCWTTTTLTTSHIYKIMMNAQHGSTVAQD